MSDQENKSQDRQLLEEFWDFLGRMAGSPTVKTVDKA